MRIGIVCPYSFDAAGGVQFHVRDLAGELLRRGHDVSVLAPSDPATPVPDFVVSAGRTVPIPYNGSVARLNFGVRTSRLVGDWLEQGAFDLVHLHEPITPSVSILALAQAQCPIVATFHSAQEKSLAYQIVSPAVQRLLEKIGARIAVSEEARRTVADHLGGDAVVIPNGVYVERFRTATPDPRWLGRRHGGPLTVAFLGRLDEPRKGLPIFAAAARELGANTPEVRFLIAGRGEAAVEHELLAHTNAEFLGGITDAEKEGLFAAVDTYVAPQTGGESFGIVLVEAMAGGSHVVASDLPAFRAVLADGKAGTLFPVDSAAGLEAALATAPDPEVGPFAATWVRQYDWATVTDQIENVYRVVLASSGKKARRFGWGRK